jgi:hypothetical protein
MAQPLVACHGSGADWNRLPLAGVCHLARTMWIAASLPAEALVIRDARKPGWNQGLEGVTAILCDAFTATSRRLPKKPYLAVYRLLADTAAAELDSYLHRDGL